MPPTSVSSSPPLWRATRATGARVAPAFAAPADLGADWLPLSQGWRQSGVEAGFQPGWARITWHETSLCYEALFMGARPRNRARRLNEPTWELGDVCEIFLQGPGHLGYVELHVTPENQRLQLSWTPDGLARVRRGELSLQEFLVNDPHWFQSSVHVGSDSWFIRAELPAKRLGFNNPVPGLHMQTAVCRYDCGDKPAPVLSSTAPLGEPSYHRRQDWHELVLVDAL